MQVTSDRDVVTVIIPGASFSIRETKAGAEIDIDLYSYTGDDSRSHVPAVAIHHRDHFNRGRPEKPDEDPRPVKPERVPKNWIS